MGEAVYASNDLLEKVLLGKLHTVNIPVFISTKKEARMSTNISLDFQESTTKKSPVEEINENIGASKIIPDSEPDVDNLSTEPKDLNLSYLLTEE